VLTGYSDSLQPSHANPEAGRYELRRQWVVEGNFRSNARHIYSRRVLRMDEDSWQITGGEMHDGRGELWRMQEIGQAPEYCPHSQLCFTTGGEFIYDTLAGRYLGLAMKSERPANTVDEGLDYLTPEYYTPANVVASAARLRHVSRAKRVGGNEKRAAAIDLGAALFAVFFLAID
jgi:hypothetical protein